MATLSPAAEYAQPPGSADQSGGPPLTLPDEHVLLLWQVAARAEDVLAAAARGRWPGTELAALADCARAGVLRQASDEETLLFHVGAPAVAARLAREHARLRSGAELLARAAGGELSLSLSQLAAATRDFVARLQRHLNAEEGLLASGHSPESVPATDISPVWREMDKLSPGGYEFVSLQDGPDRWRMRVARRYVAGY